MARTGRRPATDPSEKVLISLRGSLATKIRLVLAGDVRYRDARTGLPRYGAMSEIANQLFERWLLEQAAPAAQHDRPLGDTKETTHESMDA